MPERAEPGRVLDGDAPAAPRARRFPWNQPEVAWPLALAAGFVGTWLGLLTGVPGLAQVVATAAFAPLYVRLLGRGQVLLAGWTSVAWMLAIAAAVAGVALGGSDQEVRGLLLVSDPALLGSLGLGDGSGPSTRALRLAWHLAGLLVLLVLARPLRGVLGLGVVGLFVSGVSGAATAVAAEAGGTIDPLRACFLGWSPGLLLGLAGASMACAAVAAPGTLLPLSDLPRGRRRQLEGAVLAGAAALFFEPLYTPLWELWLRG